MYIVVWLGCRIAAYVVKVENHEIFSTLEDKRALGNQLDLDDCDI